MKRRKSAILKSLERAARPIRRRNKRLAGVRNMVEAIIVHLGKAESKVLSQAAAAAGVGRSEQASQWLTETIHAIATAMAKERVKQMEDALAARLAGGTVKIPEAPRAEG